MRLVLASSNADKLRELADLLRGLPFELVPQQSLDIDAIEETGTTFEENALLKARHAAACAGSAALADDSGLEVEALGGEPGVRSARYAGPHADDAANNAKLIAELAATSPDRRQARFRCVLAFVRGPGDDAPVIAQGAWEGRVLDRPRGANGFGYDPHFLVPELGMTAAQLDAETKNRLSHRGQAMRRLRHELERTL